MTCASQNSMMNVNEYLLGQFKDAKRNGIGKMCYSNGQVKEGMWANDQFTGQ